MNDSAKRSNREILERVALVCSDSNDWPGRPGAGGGIFHVMNENCNLMSCLQKKPHIADKFPWFAGCTEEHQIFYENLLNAMRPTFPKIGQKDDFPPSSCQWSGRKLDNSLMRFELDEEAHTYIACMQRLIQVCAPENCNQGLLARLDDNRKFMEIFYSNEEDLSCICWIKCWIQLNDIFFENLRLALDIPNLPHCPACPDGCLNKPPRCKAGCPGYPRPWPGENYYKCLLSFDVGEACL